MARRLEEAAESSQKLSADLAQCQAGSRQAEEAAKTKDEEPEQLQAKQVEEVKQATSRATTCEEKNEKMYKLSHELLEKCEHMSVGDTLLAPFEPITGLRKAKLENLFQEYEDKLQEQKAHLLGVSSLVACSEVSQSAGVICGCGARNEPGPSAFAELASAPTNPLLGFADVSQLACLLQRLLASGRSIY